ncbi:peptidoglycan D,D-transpeptidase FtsI family protein [Bacillus sp. 1P06AnD]|uniref:peptidoglycan D,D-transpeptidase FtsI family protein n=1 Tax=Bacillus sp. 1P06AnD TaxID=3132208 RepID=UPI0039A0DB1A
MKKKKKTFLPVRLSLLFFAIFLLFTALILRLGTLQVLHGNAYKKELEKTDDLTVSTAVPRGIIYDRNGKEVVGNSAVKTITYTRPKNTSSEDIQKVAEELVKLGIHKSTDEIRDRDKKDFWLLIHPKKAKKKISKKDQRLFEEEKIDDKVIYQHQLKRITKEDLATLTPHELEVLAFYREMASGRTLTPQIVKTKRTKNINGTIKKVEEVSDLEEARVSENLENLPGIDVTTDWERTYPYGSTLRSVLGNVSKSNQGLPADKLKYYLKRGYSRNDRVGTSYLEAQYEDILKGEKRKVQYISDRTGNIVDSKVLSEGKQGDDLVLSVDMDLQKALDQILEDTVKQRGVKGNTYMMDRAFAVMTNPNTGELLAMSGKMLVTDEKTGKTEMQDYALGAFNSNYVSGSVVKGATILTGYQTGAISPGTVFYDAPMKIPGLNKYKKSWKNLGPVNDLDALKMSSNVYMFRTANAIAGVQYHPNGTLGVKPNDFEKMRHFYHEFGLGVKTGIDLPGESKGYYNKYDYTPGKIWDLAIGQLDLYTPLQLAQYVSTIANDGSRLQPHLVKEVREPSNSSKKPGALIHTVEPKVLNKIDMKQSWIERVQEGFRRVMQEPGGTGYSAFGDAKYDIAGKSGTAQTQYGGPIKAVNKRYGAEDIINLSMIGYAPQKNPEVAISVVVPWAYAGNSGPSPNMEIGRKAMDTYFKLKEDREKQAEKAKKAD